MLLNTVVPLIPMNTYEDGGGGIEDPIGTYAREGKKRNPWSVSIVSFRVALIGRL